VTGLAQEHGFLCGGERVVTMGEQKAEIHERGVGGSRGVAACPNFDPQTDVVEALWKRIRPRVEIRASGR
jgi:hypothetical protein